MNMAIDEAVLSHVSGGTSPPTFRLYSWKPPAVSIGYFQGMRDEVDTERCRALGIDFVRRITGGGAVFHDSELTYSFIISADDMISRDIMESYRQICGGIMAGLKLVGIEPSFVPLNDIIAGGRKISGNAQTRRKHCVLQHGTILMDVNVEQMFSILKVPDEKIRDKLITSVKDRVTSVNAVLGRKISIEELDEAIAKGFSESLGVILTEGELSQAELLMAKELAASKYGTAEWIFKR
ncbi:MAG: biotin/lipoate A/B protein ligase family protein [archaeon]